MLEIILGAILATFLSQIIGLNDVLRQLDRIETQLKQLKKEEDESE